MKSRQQKQGSGLDERGVAVVINPRIKRRGMRCKRVNAIAVVALGVRLLKAAWEKNQPNARPLLIPRCVVEPELVGESDQGMRRTEPSSYLALHASFVHCTSNRWHLQAEYHRRVTRGQWLLIAVLCLILGMEAVALVMATLYPELHSIRASVTTDEQHVRRRHTKS